MSEILIDGVTKLYDEVVALDRITLRIPSGESLVVMGPSGSGKTTLLLTLLGILRPEYGSIYVNGQEVTNLSVEDRNFGYMPQDYGLFPHMTVFENIAFGLRLRGVSKAKTVRKVEDLLSLVDMKGFKERRPSELSGGERQRIALARALAIDPLILLLDEPLSSIDEITKADVRSRLKKTVKEAGVTTICVLHEPDDAAALGDRIAIIYCGKIIQTGTLKELIEQPEDQMVNRLLTSHLLDRRHTREFDRREDFSRFQK